MTRYEPTIFKLQNSHKPHHSGADDVCSFDARRVRFDASHRISGQYFERGTQCKTKSSPSERFSARGRLKQKLDELQEGPIQIQRKLFISVQLDTSTANPAPAEPAGPLFTSSWSWQTTEEERHGGLKQKQFSFAGVCERLLLHDDY